MGGWRQILFFVLLTGCQRGPSPVESTDRYFSLERYFNNQIAALESQNRSIEKTVRKNQELETRTIANPDWAVELKAFVNSDINKPAWRNSYRIDSIAPEASSPEADNLTYTAQEADLRVRAIRIRRDPQGTIRRIVIERSETNYLYTSRETLTYVPDSLYAIERLQEVRVLGVTEFQVSGLF